MNIQTTFWVKIYISGSIETVKQACRKNVYENPLCVTIEPVTYVYTGGEEQGVVVGLINYPRFPSPKEEIWARARELALVLLKETYQRSVLIMSPYETEWLTDGE